MDARGCRPRACGHPGLPVFPSRVREAAWNACDGPTIALADVEAAAVLALDDLDRGFFRARIDRTTDALCYAPRHGELAFTVPMLFDGFVRRVLS